MKIVNSKKLNYTIRSTFVIAMVVSFFGACQIDENNSLAPQNGLSRTQINKENNLNLKSASDTVLLIAEDTILAIEGPGTDIESGVIDTNGVIIPYIQITGMDIIYTVLIDTLYEVKSIMKQSVTTLANGNKKFEHWVDNNYIGNYITSSDGNELVEFQGIPASEPLPEFDCEAKEGESCAGCHYRVVRAKLFENGDKAIKCTILNIIGFGMCDALIYTFAYIHCVFSHLPGF